MEDGWDSFSDPQLGGPPPHRKQINNRKSKQGNKHRAPRPQATGWADEQSFLRTFHPHATEAPKAHKACTAKQLQRLTHAVAVATEESERKWRKLVREQAKMLQVCNNGL